MSLLKLRPIHPGELLQEQLEELGMSARALALRLGLAAEEGGYLPSNRWPPPRPAEADDRGPDAGGRSGHGPVAT